MKPGSRILGFFEALVIWVFTFLGALLLMAGLALLLYQAYLYVNLGIWGQMPASSLFIESRIPIDRLQVLKDVEQAPAQVQLPSSVRERIVYEKLYSTVPDWFRSNTSWLAKPQTLHGLHDMAVRILDFLSVSGMLLFVGAFFIGVSLSKPKSEVDWERRDPTL